MLRDCFSSLLREGRFWKNPKHVNIHIFGKGHKEKYFFWQLRQAPQPAISAMAAPTIPMLEALPICDESGPDASAVVVAPSPMKLCSGTSLHRLPLDCPIVEIEFEVLAFHSASDPAFKGAPCPVHSVSVTLCHALHRMCIALCILS